MSEHKQKLGGRICVGLKDGYPEGATITWSIGPSVAFVDGWPMPIVGYLFTVTERYGEIQTLSNLKSALDPA